MVSASFDVSISKASLAAAALAKLCDALTAAVGVGVVASGWVAMAVSFVMFVCAGSLLRPHPARARRAVVARMVARMVMLANP